MIISNIEINKNNGIISTKEVLKFGIHKDVLKKLTEKKEIIKIANGLYGLPNEEIDEYIDAIVTSEEAGIEKPNFKMYNYIKCSDIDTRDREVKVVQFWRGEWL